MTTNDYTTDGPAVFDEVSPGASGSESGAATASPRSASPSTASTPSEASSTEVPSASSASASNATPSSATASDAIASSATASSITEREPELVGASANAVGSTQPTVPLSASARPTIPQGGFGADPRTSTWNTDHAQGPQSGPGAGATGYGTPYVGAPGYGAPQAGAPGYSMPAAATPATVHPPQRRTSLLAVLTLVFGILGFGVVPVVTGHIALSQLKRTGEEGRGLALAGLILGYVTLAGWVLAILAWLGVAGAALLAAFFGAIAH